MPRSALLGSPGRPPRPAAGNPGLRFYRLRRLVGGMTVEGSKVRGLEFQGLGLKGLAFAGFQWRVFHLWVTRFRAVGLMNSPRD